MSARPIMDESETRELRRALERVVDALDSEDAGQIADALAEMMPVAADVTHEAAARAYGPLRRRWTLADA